MEEAVFCEDSEDAAGACVAEDFGGVDAPNGVGALLAIGEMVELFAPDAS